MNTKSNVDQNVQLPTALVICCGDYDAHGCRHAETSLTPLEQIEQEFRVRFYQSQPGGLKDFIDPDAKEYRAVVSRQLQNALRIKEFPEYVIIVHHHDCGAYAHLLQDASHEMQRDFHFEELSRARTLLAECFPEYHGSILEYYLHHDGIIRPVNRQQSELCIQLQEKLSA